MPPDQFQKYNKYIVIKIDDLKLYADSILWKLDDVLKKIQYGREKDGQKQNHYVVVNEDEPYADEVWGLIKRQWDREHQDKTKQDEKLGLKEFM